MSLLQQTIADQVRRHGSYRAAAKVLRVDHGYLWRLGNGDKDNADDVLLRRLGLRRIVTYERIKP